MTEERMALAELVQKAGDGDCLRAVAEAVRQIPMEADVEGLVGAARHERSPDPALMDESEHEMLGHMAFPAQHRANLHSTNPLERLNKEVKLRTDVVGIFPNEAAIVRPIGAVLREQNDEWQLPHRYMQLQARAELTPPAARTEQRQLPPQAA